MFKVLYKEEEAEFADLDQAMAYAKIIGEFVTISGNGFEIVGRFGVDSVQNGVCPDGVKYDWNKESRIGAPKRNEKVQKNEKDNWDSCRWRWRR